MKLLNTDCLGEFQFLVFLVEEADCELIIYEKETDETYFVYTNTHDDDIKVS